MSGNTWTIQFAPQMGANIRDVCKTHGWGFHPIPSCPGFATLQGASDHPARDYPFIRRQWRHDFAWPGALRLEDFLSRAGTGLIERFGSNLPANCEISLTTSFRDRSHLGSRLLQLLKQELHKAQKKPALLTESRMLSKRALSPGLHVLLTNCPRRTVDQRSNAPWHRLRHERAAPNSCRGCGSSYTLAPFGRAHCFYPQAWRNRQVGKYA